MTPEEQIEWDEWLEERPEKVRKVAIDKPPGVPYLLKTTNQVVWILQYDEPLDDSAIQVTVAIFTQDNPTILMDRNVFGIDPYNLKEISDEELGKIRSNKPTRGILGAIVEAQRNYTKRLEGYNWPKEGHAWLKEFMDRDST